MALEQELQNGFNNDQYHILITDADELLAAWRYKRCHSGRTTNLSAVPAKWRLSCPPNEKVATIPCQVTTRHQKGKAITGFDPRSTMHCHGHGAVKKTNGDLVPIDMSPLELVQYLHKKSEMVSPILDAFTLARIGKELGYSRIIPKVLNGRQYLAVTGYAGQRTGIIKGTLYKPTNPSIIKLGIGWRGAANSAAKGGLIAIYITVPFRIAEHMLSDDKCRYKLFENVASDVIQIGAGAIAGAIAAGGLMALSAPVIFSAGLGVVIAMWVSHESRVLLKETKVIKGLADWFRDIRDGRHVHGNPIIRDMNATGGANVRRTGHTGLYGGI